MSFRLVPKLGDMDDLERRNI